MKQLVIVAIVLLWITGVIATVGMAHIGHASFNSRFGHWYQHHSSKSCEWTWQICRVV